MIESCQYHVWISLRHRRGHCGRSRTLTIDEPSSNVQSVIVKGRRAALCSQYARLTSNMRISHVALLEASENAWATSRKTPLEVASTCSSICQRNGSTRYLAVRDWRTCTWKPLGIGRTASLNQVLLSCKFTFTCTFEIWMIFLVSSSICFNTASSVVANASTLQLS